MKWTKTKETGINIYVVIVLGIVLGVLLSSEPLIHTAIVLTGFKVADVIADIVIHLYNKFKNRNHF